MIEGWDAELRRLRRDEWRLRQGIGSAERVARDAAAAIAWQPRQAIPAAFLVIASVLMIACEWAVLAAVGADVDGSAVAWFGAWILVGAAAAAWLVGAVWDKRFGPARLIRAEVQIFEQQAALAIVRASLVDLGATPIRGRRR